MQTTPYKQTTVNESNVSFTSMHLHVFPPQLSVHNEQSTIPFTPMIPTIPPAISPVDFEEVPRPLMIYPTSNDAEPQWSYKVIARLASEEPLDEGELDKLGEQGWELVAIVPTGKQIQFYFKRLA